MLNDISLYKNTKRNEKCPCGSGRIFKKCCMKEYREVKKKQGNVQFSTFSPIKSLSEEESQEFISFYHKLFFFSYKKRHNSKVLVFDSISKLIIEERPYFYENKEQILENFVQEYELNENEKEIIEAIKNAKYGFFFLCEYKNDRAVVADDESSIYNVQSLIEPFSTLFPSKNLILQTALLYYKGRFLMDGQYNIIDKKGLDVKQVRQEMFQTSIHNTQHKKETSIILFPFNINVVLFCVAPFFEKMEDIVLKKTPKKFTQKLLKLFDDKPFESLYLCSSLLRTTDFLKEYNEDDEKATFLTNALATLNYEKYENNAVIPYEALEYFYKQKPLSQSRSEGIYRQVEEEKEKQKNGEESIKMISSFYTMLGIAYIDENNIDEFRFLKDLTTKESREAFTEGFEALCQEFSKEIHTEILPLFLDFALDFDSIADEIDDYRKYLGKTLLFNPKKLRKYSIYKNKASKKFSFF